MFEIVFKESLPPQEALFIENLKKEIFSDVPEDEAKEDFYCKPMAHVLAYSDKKIVGYVGIYKRIVPHQDREMVLGGIGGLMVVPEFRKQGLGKAIALRGLDKLKEMKVDLAFLSVDTNKTTDQFYKKIGFIDLPQHFSWTNSRGEIKSDDGGMIAPMGSRELFEEVFNSNEVLYVGKGYW